MNNPFTKLLSWLFSPAPPKKMTDKEIKHFDDLMFPPNNPTIDLSPASPIKRFKLKQRFPNSFSGFAAEVYVFNTAEELMQAEFVKRWMSKEEFNRLSLSSYGINQRTLMAEHKNGGYWAIGFISNLLDGAAKNDMTGLQDFIPEWISPSRKAKEQQ